MHDAKQVVQELLQRADIQINGTRPWDIQVHDERFYTRLFKNPELELGDTYVEGCWDCAQLDEAFTRIFRADLERIVQSDKRFLYGILYNKIKSALTRIINYQSKTKAYEVGRRHYDIGNDLYQLMLDQQLNYSCAYWKNSRTLDEAQNAKLELVCQKLGLKPGMQVLDIGCGWGAFAKYAAEKYHVSVIGTTISEQQYHRARELCQGLPIEIKMQDYRDITDQFDRICSIGMFEHVGYRNYRRYMKVANRCLKDDGLFLLHCIGVNTSLTRTNPWIDKHIFPNGGLPSIKQIGAAIENLFIMEDWHNFGADYDTTLLAWYANFNQHWDTLKTKYNEEFRRMWNFYLMSSAGAFRARELQLWQIVLSKKGLPGGYLSLR